MTRTQKKAGGKRMPKDGSGEGPVRSPREGMNCGRQQATKCNPCGKTAKSKDRRGASDARAGLDKEGAEIWAELERAFSRRGGFPGRGLASSVKKIFDSLERYLNALMDTDRRGKPGRSTGRWH